jgi:predicted 2-oxoglutarate/Fe(II)-dependent dioxygenase YbiX|tara:strand:+ start:444 stop:1091 length:648 start_codon:yes stop_codon:yes gene_type:complete
MVTTLLKRPVGHTLHKSEIKVEHVYSHNFVNIYDMPSSVVGCEKIIKHAENGEWKDSEVIGPDGTGVVNPEVRKSVQQNFPSYNSPKEHSPILRYASKCLENYLETFPTANNFTSFAVNEDYNIIRYEEGEAYHALHSDFVSDFKSPLSHRHLSGVCFLNDVETGGELVFPQQDLEIKPEAGLLVIFPSGWTHAHQTLPVVGQNRYVFQLWWSFA